jgi:hypothetical protein
MTAAVTTHTGARQGHINWQRPHANYQESAINGRPAEDWELEVRERAYQRQAQQAEDLVRVAPRSTDG